METIVCQLVGYRIHAVAAILTWDFSEGTYPVNSGVLSADHYPTEEEIRKAIISNERFGAQEVEGAVYTVERVYQHGARQFDAAHIINTGHQTNNHVAGILSMGYPEAVVSLDDVSSMEYQQFVKMSA